MFTCTGSEAVDLALRVARFYTGGEGVVITANAYHGVTAAAAEISPSLGPAVPLGRSVWTVAPPTDQTFAHQVRAAIADMNRHGVRLAAFIADSLFSSDGIRPDPAGISPASGGGRARRRGTVHRRRGPARVRAVRGRRCGASSATASCPTWPSWASRWATACRSPESRPAPRSSRSSAARSGTSTRSAATRSAIAAAAAVLDVIEAEGLRQNALAVGLYLRDTLEGDRERRAADQRRPGVWPVRRGRLRRRPRHRRAGRRHRDPRRQRPARPPRS